MKKTLSLFIIIFIFGCAKTYTKKQQKILCQTPLRHFNKGNFQKALNSSKEVLSIDSNNSCAYFIQGLSRYFKTIHNLTLKFFELSRNFRIFSGIPYKKIFALIESTEKNLNLVYKDLKKASNNQDINIPFTPGYWKVDWNNNGKIERRETELFDVEYDLQKNRIKRGSRLRKPTWHLDVGDIHWAMAMISFQRTIMNFVLSYQWPNITEIFLMMRGKKLAIPIRSKDRYLSMKKHLLRGVNNTLMAQKYYLSETDDKGEWIPNPNQKKYYIPLVMDKKVYQNWKNILIDIKNLVLGKEGLPVNQIGSLSNVSVFSKARGFINFGKLLENPKTIVINPRNIRTSQGPKARQEAFLSEVFGVFYVKNMTPSKIVKHLLQVKNDFLASPNMFRDKLKYVMWLN